MSVERSSAFSRGPWEFRILELDQSWGAVRIRTPYTGGPGYELTGPVGDVRLMAAAPFLLAACQSLVEAYKAASATNFPMLWTIDLTDIANHAEQAVAVALGEMPWSE